MAMNFISQRYKVLGKKGEGTFSDVLKCQDLQDNSMHACKRMKQHYESMDQVNNLREIQAMRRINPHPHIVQLEEVLFDRKTGTLVLVVELMDMNIYELIKGRRHYLSDQKVKSYMYQLCKAIEHLHRNGIFHRDVKPENILIKVQSDQLKLADFGSCRSIYSKQPYTEYISTRWYRAPECLLTDGYYGQQMDMWSVGCVMFEIMSLHPLFPGSNEIDQITKIHEVLGTPDNVILGKLRNRTRGMNFNFPHKKGVGIEKLLPQASSESIDLIYKLCAYDPDLRLTAKQTLKHAYFKELRDADKRTHRAKKEQEKLSSDKENIHIEQETEEKSVMDELRSENNTIQTVDKHRTDQGKNTQKQEETVGTVPKKKHKGLELADLHHKYQEAPSTRPESGNSTTTTLTTLYSVRYPNNNNLVFQSKDPLALMYKRDQRKKRQRTDPVIGYQHVVSTYRYQPSFPSFLPKIKTTSTTTSSATATFLPNLAGAYGKPTKTKVHLPSKGLHNPYQLPSIDKREM